MSVNATVPQPVTAPEVIATVQQGEQVEITLRVPANLSWFDGHFSGMPLLPGVIQTTWAVEFARQYFAQYLQATPLFRSMSNMKFMRFIFPGAELVLRLRYIADKHELAFEYCQAGQVCASGRIGFGA